jgi:hypothetical protein
MALAGTAALGTTALPSGAQVQPITSEILTPRSVFTDDVGVKIKNKVDDHATEVVGQRTAPGRWS